MSDEKQTVENEDIIKEKVGDNGSKPKKEKVQWKKKLLIVLLILITCSSLGVAFWALFVRNDKRKID